MTLTKVLLGATAGAAILASSVMTASAAIVCNGNVCWHVHASRRESVLGKLGHRRFDHVFRPA